MEITMNKEPLISVLMGIYNCAETLPEAINCILAQTYHNWQLIMCDDGSTDNTYEVAQSFAEKDERFILLRNRENLGLNKTLNKCLSFADGEYIARMDGDDICSPDRFAKEICFLNCHPEYALVSCKMTMFDEEGEFRTVDYCAEPTRKQLVRASQFCHAGCMMRTSVMKELGGYSESVNCQRVEDYDLWVRLYSSGYKGFNIQEALYAMRDDRNAKKRRTFQARLNEGAVSFRAGKAFDYPVYGLVCSLIPVLKWFAPNSLYALAHRKQWIRK